METGRPRGWDLCSLQDHETHKAGSLDSLCSTAPSTPSVLPPSEENTWVKELLGGKYYLCLCASSRFRGDMPTCGFIRSLQGFSLPQYFVFLWLTYVPIRLAAKLRNDWEGGSSPASVGHTCPSRVQFFQISWHLQLLSEFLKKFPWPCC